MFATTRGISSSTSRSGQALSLSGLLIATCLSISIGLGQIRAEDPKPEKPKDAPPAKVGAKAEPAVKAKPDAKPQPAAKPDAKPAAAGSVSFMKDVAPVLVQNCVGCHNARKSESKYNMTAFASLAKGGQQGEGVTLEPGDPDASYFVELIRHDANPRMPYKQDPLPLEKVALIERWVKEGAKYDGAKPDEDWTAVLRKNRPVNIPESYPVAVPITALAFSPDGSSLAASGYHEVNLWKLADGSLSTRVRGLAERIYAIAYTADGKFMATASGDPGQFGSVKLWSSEANGSAKFVRELAELPDSAYAVVFSADGKLVAAGGADRAIRIWETGTGKQLALIEDHADWVLDLAFSPDGKRLASASRDKTSKVFDVAKAEALVTFPGHAETVNTVAFAPDGKSVATGGRDNQVRIWNPDDDAKAIRNIGGFGAEVLKIRFSPDGKTLAACGADKQVRLFNPSNGAVIKTLEGHADWVYSLAISSDGKVLASGGWDGQVRLWNLADGTSQKALSAVPGMADPSTKAK